MTGATALQKAAAGGEINQCARQEFLSLYPNRIRHIYKPAQEAAWKSLAVRLATGMIDAAVSCECDFFYGAYWGDLTRFAILDVDVDSKYHNAQELQRLRENLAAVGLANTAFYQSSRSTGWWMYIPFEDWVDRKEVESALKAWLKALGYELRGGVLEVFPSGNALRLPLQSGFAWLDDNGAVVLRREELGPEAAISRFLYDLKANVNNWDEAKRLIDSQLSAVDRAAGGDAQGRQERLDTAGLEELFSGGKIQENWEQGRKLWLDGLSEKGQRHNAVLFVGHYLWYGDPEAGIAALPGARHDEYRARLIEEWLNQKHNGYCRHIDKHKWEEIHAQIKRAVLWRADGQKQEYEPYRLTDRLLKRLLAIYRRTGTVWTVEDFQRANEDRRDQARNKISQAVSYCLSEGLQISRTTLAGLTGCSPNTLRKHADIWRLLAIGSGEYNSGGAGGFLVLPGSLPLDLATEEDFFTPVLAADSGELDREEILSVSLVEASEQPEILNPKEQQAFPVQYLQPYVSQRRPSSFQCSASVPLRRLASQEVLAAAEKGGIKKSRRHDSTARSKNVAPWTVQAVYGTDLGQTYRPSDVHEIGEASIYRFIIDTGK